MATKPAISHSFPFSGVSLKGGAATQEDAFYVDPQLGALLLLDGAGASPESTKALLRETLTSFGQAVRKNQGLGEWLESWNGAVFRAMKNKRLEDRSTASVLAARLRSQGLWEFVVMGKLSLYEINPSEAFPLFLNSQPFPLASLGSQEKCRFFSGAYATATGSWLVAGSGDFSSAQFLPRLNGIRDFLLSQDLGSPDFRQSAKRYVENEMLAPNGNSSLIWLGR